MVTAGVSFTLNHSNQRAACGSVHKPQTQHSCHMLDFWSAGCCSGGASLPSCGRCTDLQARTGQMVLFGFLVLKYSHGVNILEQQ